MKLLDKIVREEQQPEQLLNYLVFRFANLQLQRVTGKMEEVVERVRPQRWTAIFVFISKKLCNLSLVSFK